MKKLLNILVLIALFGYNSCTSQTNLFSGYNLASPDLNIDLPEILHEISGITVIDSVTLACVQDEKGIIFFYNFKSEMIVNQLTFASDGDYEDIARVNNNLYVLRSDGVIFFISDFKTAHSPADSIITGINAKESEGLCYDSDQNRLLIGCKTKAGNGSEFKDRKAIYAYNLDNMSTSQVPVFNFNLNEIRDFAQINNIQLPEKTKKNGEKIIPDIKMRISSIAIHPITKKIFILSAAEYLLFICNANGEIEHIQQLNPLLFNKAEGIAFMPNGDMLISNEGQNNKPRLLRFNHSN
ncbi:MAG: hypothetical protein PHT69_12180 [Bacteroidales bacterium]|nr:hypothetical protein [Bacteroidales bacterium]